MDLRADFFASLTDGQLELYYAHEHDDNFCELLQDELKMKQYLLFEKWKEQEKSIANENGQQTVVLKELSNKIDKMMDTLTTRIDSIEMRMENKFKVKVPETVHIINESAEKHILEPVEHEKVDGISIDTSTVDVTSINMDEARKWLDKIKQNVEKCKEEHIIADLINKIIEMLKKFEDSVIENDGCSLLSVMIDHSKLTGHLICNNPGAMEHFMKILKRIREQRAFNQHSVLHVFVRIAECEETQTLLMKYEYLVEITSLLGDWTDSGLTSNVFLSSVICAYLLDLPKDAFPSKLTKEIVEKKVVSAHERPSFFKPISPYWVLIANCSWYLNKMISGTEAQKCVCAYTILSDCYLHCKRFFKLSAIPVLELVVSDRTSRSVVVHIHASKALKWLKLYNT